jgi:hypothetical protein
VNGPDNRPPLDAATLAAQRVGLCATCRHVRRVVSARGSEFYLCERSRTEPARFRKYPPLPVRQCSGFEKQ